MTTLMFLNLDPNFIGGLITGGIISLVVAIVLFIYKVLAPKNIFFTFGKENHVIHVMTGKKFSGKVIMPSKTLYVDTKSYDIKPINEKGNKPNQSWFSKLTGMYWIGIYPFRIIYERRQQWLEWKSNDKGKREIRVRDEMTPYLIVKPFEYTMLLEEGEDKNGIPLNVYFTVILYPTNALLPIFGNNNAYGQVQTLCRTETLSFVKEKTFANLGDGNKILPDEFSNKICSLNDKIPGRPDGLGIEKVLGYKIMDAKLDSIEIVGNLKDELLKASTAQYVAEENAKGEVKKAIEKLKITKLEAEGKKLSIIAEAEGDLEANKLGAQGKELLLKVDADYLKNISAVPGAMKVEERKVTPGLTTLVEADNNKKTNLLIGGK